MLRTRSWLSQSSFHAAISVLQHDMLAAGCAAAGQAAPAPGFRSRSPACARVFAAAHTNTEAPPSQRSVSSAAALSQLYASASSPRPAGQASLLQLEASPSQQQGRLLEVEEVSAGLALTWLSHWQAVEAEQQFRRQVQESTRGRQRRRHQYLASLLSEDNSLLPSSSSSASSDSEEEAGLAPPLGAHVREQYRAAAAADPSRAHLQQRRQQHQQQQQGQGQGWSASQQQDTLVSQQTSDVDDLTWLASHPPSGESSEEPHPPLENAGRQMRGWEQQAAEGLIQPVSLRVGWETVSVRPLWIAVHQPEGSTSARLFESVAPLQPELVDRLSLDLSPFCSISGLSFSSPDVRHGLWRNYFVGLVGEVAVVEDDILWPNQVLHRDRVLYNVRSAWDVAKFLADPQLEDVLQHQANLQRLAEERGYHRGWCWHMLRARWGEGALRALGLRQPAQHDAAAA